MTHADLIDRLRAKCAEAGSQAALARQIGVSRMYINNILNGHAPISDTVLNGIGIERVVTYQEAIK